LDKSSALITHYSNENYDLKQEVDLHKKLKEVAQNDYFEIKKENLFLKENNNKVKEKGKGLRTFLNNISNSTSDQYKLESKKRYEKIAQDELDKWNRHKNCIN
jgi:hypothetical protein